MTSTTFIWVFGIIGVLVGLAIPRDMPKLTIAAIFGLWIGFVLVAHRVLVG